jgi:hypothetical protein
MAQKGRSIKRRKARATRGNVTFFLLASVVFLAIAFLAYSKYTVKTGLLVELLGQESSCYTGQDSLSSGSWNGSHISMETGFETPDPCYAITSITAEQQAERMEINIRTSHGGMCVQCFGFTKVRYEIKKPATEKKTDVLVKINGVSSERLVLLAT